MTFLLAILLPGLAGLGLWFWAHQRWTRNEPAIIAAAGAVVVLLLVLVAGYTWRGRQLEAARSEARAGSLVRDSLEAALDTLEQLHAAADSGRAVWERRATQAELERDRVDELLRTERTSSVALAAEVRELRATVSAAVAIDSLRPDVRLVESTIRDGPYTVLVKGEIPPPPRRASLSVVVRVDPVELAVDVRCGEPGPAGIRPAHVTVDGPDWLEISAVDGRVDPRGCNPPPPPPPTIFERIRIGAPYLAAGILIGGGLVLLFR